MRCVFLAPASKLVYSRRSAKSGRRYLAATVLQQNRSSVCVCVRGPGLHNSPAEIKNPYGANSIRGKREKKKEIERTEERGMEEEGDRKEGAGWLRSPACLLCEKAAVAC